MRQTNRVLAAVLGICLLCSIYGINIVEASSMNFEKMSEHEIKGSSQNSGVVFSVVETDMIRIDLRFREIVVTIEKSISSDNGFYVKASSTNNGGIVKFTPEDYQVLQHMLSEMSVYGESSNLSKSFLSILNLLESWPKTMPVYASISESSVNTLTSEYNQRTHNRLMPLSDYKPMNLCKLFTNSLYFFWPVVVSGVTVSTPYQSGTIGQNGCFGRCGMGCSSYSTESYNNIYSFACARHDACVVYMDSILGTSGSIWPDCDYLFPAAIPDFIIGYLSTAYDGTQYNCGTVGN